MFAAHEVFDASRRLSEDTASESEFDAASRMAQIFSGVMFGALSCYLIFSNSTRMSYIQRASLEKRLNVCCQINTIVAAISCFLNFFQITEVDNWLLPGDRNNRQFTVDVARPIEWILTCPLMQLSLVLMGGSRIPEYRRVVMPAFAVVVLLWGSSTLFLDEPWTYIAWGCGLITHFCAMGFNRQQILEHSRGAEGLLSGDSEFRKATLILMLTWFPFPAWYILSPEGTNLIKDVTVVQMGWAFLNITAKFTLIFYLQRIKDNYCNRLKVTREMKGGMRGPMELYDEEEDEDGKIKDVGGDVRACVMETMNFLGMSENVDRFLRLLRRAKLYTLDDIARLEPADCDKLQLPYDLIRAVQKRHRVWALEMIDDAEKGLEAGEKAYELAEKDKKTAKEKEASKDAGKRQKEQDTVIPVGAIVPTTPSNQPTVPFGYIPGAVQPGPMFQPATTGFSNNAFEAFSNISPPARPQMPPEPRTMHSDSLPWSVSSPSPFPSDSPRQMDQKMLDTLDAKLDRVIEAVGRKIEKSEEALDMRIKQSENMFKNYMQDMGSEMERSQKAMEQSQVLMEGKVEKVCDSVKSQIREQREQVRTELWNMLQQLPGFTQPSQNPYPSQGLPQLQIQPTQPLANTFPQYGPQQQPTPPNAFSTNTYPQQQQQAPAQSYPRADSPEWSNAANSQMLQKRMDDAVLKLELVSTQLGGSVNQMTSGWTQHTQQIEMKVSGLGDQLTRTCQEQLSKRDASLNDSIRSKIEDLIRSNNRQTEDLIRRSNDRDNNRDNGFDNNHGSNNRFDNRDSNNRGSNNRGHSMDSRLDSRQLEREMEDLIRTKIEQVLNDCMQTFCMAAAQEARQAMQSQQQSYQQPMQLAMQTQMQPYNQFQDRQSSNVELSVTAFHKFEQIENNLVRAQKDLNEECEKNISMGIGVVGNSLRLQIDNLSTAHHSQFIDIEKMLKDVLERMQDQSKKDSERMQHIEICVKDCADRALRDCADKVSKTQMEELREFQKRIEGAMREQAKATEKTNSVITSALAGGGGGLASPGGFDRSPSLQRGMYGNDSNYRRTSTSRERGGDGLHRDDTGRMKWGGDKPGRSYWGGTGGL